MSQINLTTQCKKQTDKKRCKNMIEDRYKYCTEHGCPRCFLRIPKAGLFCAEDMCKNDPEYVQPHNASMCHFKIDDNEPCFAAKRKFKGDGVIIEYDYCATHNCKIVECLDSIYEESRYCYEHTCIVEGCLRQAILDNEDQQCSGCASGLPAEHPTPIIEEPVQVIEEPVQVIEQPVQVIEQPLVAETSPTDNKFSFLNHIFKDGNINPACTTPLFAERIFTERFNIQKLAFILLNNTKFPSRSNARDSVDLPKFYAGAVVDGDGYGVKQTTYHYGNNNVDLCGRYMAVGSCSFQGMLREARHLIAFDTLVDIDICNAHPVFILHLCDWIGFKSIHVRRYVEERNAIFKELHEFYGDSKSKDDFKNLFLTINNNGKKALREFSSSNLGLVSFISDYNSEMIAIRSAIFKKLDGFKKLSDRIHDSKKRSFDNKEGSAMSHICCYIENQCLYKTFLHIADVIGLENACKSVLCFDGIMIDKVSFEMFESKQGSLVSSLEDMFDKLGFQLKWAIKYMEPMCLNSLGYEDGKDYKNIYDAELIKYEQVQAPIATQAEVQATTQAEVQATPRVKCRAFKRDGCPCRSEAVEGTTRCQYHQDTAIFTKVVCLSDGCQFSTEHPSGMCRKHINLSYDKSWDSFEPSYSILNEDRDEFKRIHSLYTLLPYKYFYTKESVCALVGSLYTDEAKCKPIVAKAVILTLIREKALDLFSLQDSEEIVSKGAGLINYGLHMDFPFSKVLGICRNVAANLVAEWESQYKKQPVVAKFENPRYMSKSQMKAEEEQSKAELIDTLASKIVALGGSAMHDKSEAVFSDILMMHNNSIEINDFAKFLNQTMVILHRAGVVRILARENSIYYCNKTNQTIIKRHFVQTPIEPKGGTRIMLNIVLDDGSVVRISKTALLSDLHSRLGKTYTYKEYGSYPYGPRSSPPNLHGHSFNLFGGFMHDYDSNYTMSSADGAALDKFLAMYKDILCAGNAESFEFEINKLAHMVQNPSIKSQAVSIFKGGQGIGKSVLLEFLTKYVFGEHLSITIYSKEQLISRFNSHLSGKLMVVLEEGVDLADANSVNTFKGMIRCPSINVEVKGSEIVSMPCNLNFFIATNNDYNRLFSERDERVANYNVVSEKYKGNKDFFREAVELLYSFEAGKAVFHYLVNKDLTGFNVRKVPQTDAKLEKKISSSPSFIKFMYDMYQEQLDARMVQTKINGGDTPGVPSINEDGFDCNLVALMGYYKQYCEYHGEMAMVKQSKIRDELLPLMKGFTGRCSKGRPRYTICKESLSVFLNGYFEVDSF